MCSEPRKHNQYSVSEYSTGEAFLPVRCLKGSAGSLMGKGISPVASGSLSLPTDLPSAANGDN